MWKVAAGIAAAVAIATVAAGVAPASSGKTSLRLTSLRPLIVQGERFAPRERVRVELSGPASAMRRVVASPAGTFTVTFAGVTVTRCDVVRVVAIRSPRGNVELKRLPPPACQTQ